MRPLGKFFDEIRPEGYYFYPKMGKKWCPGKYRLLLTCPKANYITLSQQIPIVWGDFPPNTSNVTTRSKTVLSCK